METGFNEDGSLKIEPKLKKRLDEYNKKLARAEANPKIKAKYNVNWEIIVPTKISKQKLVQLCYWANQRHKFSFGKLDLENYPSIYLIESGRPCLFAHTFLNALNTMAFREHELLVEIVKSCKHKFSVKDRP